MEKKTSSIEITISGHKYVLKGDEPEEHLREVAELVRRRVDSFRKKTSSMTLHKAAILAAFEFASDSIKGRRKALDYKAKVLAKASSILEKVQAET